PTLKFSRELRKPAGSVFSAVSASVESDIEPSADVTTIPNGFASAANRFASAVLALGAGDAIARKITPSSGSRFGFVWSATPSDGELKAASCKRNHGASFPGAT